MRRAILFFAALLLPPVAYANPITTRFEDIPGQKARRVVTSGLIEAVPSKVWDVITDYDHYQEFMPKVAESVILEKTPSTVRYRSRVDMPWPIANVSYECEVTFTKVGEHLEFRMVPGTGKGVKQFEGSWNLEAVPDHADHTTVTYTLLYEADRWYPRWAVELGTKSTVAKIIESVRRRANQPVKPASD